MDALKYVAPGAPLVITAGTWNRFIDAARRSEAEPRPTAGARPLDGDPWRPALTVLVENTGESVLAARTILTPTAVGLDPEADPLLARRRPLVQGAAPAAATDPVLVVLDGIGPGEIGRAVVSGATVAQVSISSTAHRFARPLAGYSSHLISAASGPVRLLVPPTSTGTKNVYVLLGGGGTSSSSGGGGSGGDGTCFGNGWRIGLTAEDQWALRVGDEADAVLIEDGATVEINGIEYTIAFNYAVPSLSLTSSLPSAAPIVGTLDCTACPCIKFAFRRSGFGLDETVPHGMCARVLYVTVCQYCPPGWYCARPAGTTQFFEPVELDEGEACSPDLEVLPGGPWESEAVARQHCGETPSECASEPQELPPRNVFDLVIEGMVTCPQYNGTWRMIYGNSWPLPYGCYYDIAPYPGVDSPGMRILRLPATGASLIRLWVSLGPYTWTYYYDETAHGVWDWRSSITLEYAGFCCSDFPPFCDFPATITIYPV